jgi:hypothetical protein
VKKDINFIDTMPRIFLSNRTLKGNRDGKADVILQQSVQAKTSLNYLIVTSFLLSHALLPYNRALGTLNNSRLTRVEPICNRGEVRGGHFTLWIVPWVEHHLSAGPRLALQESCNFPHVDKPDHHRPE